MLRRASLPATLAARKAEIPVFATDPPEEPAVTIKPYRPRPRALPSPAGAEPHQRIVELTGALVDRTPPKVVTPGNAAEAAEALLGYLRDNGYAQ